MKNVLLKEFAETDARIREIASYKNYNREKIAKIIAQFYTATLNLLEQYNNHAKVIRALKNTYNSLEEILTQYVENKKNIFLSQLKTNINKIDLNIATKILNDIDKTALVDRNAWLKHQITDIAVAHLAIKQNYLKSISDTTLKKILKLIEDPNLLNKNGHSLLLVATKIGNLKAVMLLLEKGSDINIVDENGKTALDHILDDLEQTEELSDSDSSTEDTSSTKYEKEARAKDLEILAALLRKGVRNFDFSRFNDNLIKDLQKIGYNLYRDPKYYIPSAKPSSKEALAKIDEDYDVDAIAASLGPMDNARLPATKSKSHKNKYSNIKQKIEDSKPQANAKKLSDYEDIPPQIITEEESKEFAIVSHQKTSHLKNIPSAEDDKKYSKLEPRILKNEPVETYISYDKEDDSKPSTPVKSHDYYDPLKNAKLPYQDPTQTFSLPPSLGLFWDENPMPQYAATYPTLDNPYHGINIFNLESMI